MSNTASSSQRLSADVLSEIGDLRLTNPDRVLYPDDGITKLDLVRYYVSIAHWILPHLVDRPLSLVRCPDGLDGKCFFQKHPVRGMPESIGRQVPPDQPDDEEHLFIRDLRGLLSLVQFSSLELHPWGSRIDRPARPDRIVFDLDPDEGLPWSRVVAAARECHDRLEELGLQSFVKTTGGKGLHVVVPIVRRHGWQEVKEFARAIADRMTADSPRDYTANMSKSARGGKVFVDVNRNDRGATSVAAYSPRARPGAPVSVPLNWDELSSRAGANQHHIGTVAKRLATLTADPWAEMGELRQSITAQMKRQVAARKGRQ